MYHVYHMYSKSTSHIAYGILYIICTCSVYIYISIYIDRYIYIDCDWLAGVPNQMAHRAHHLKLQASSLVLPLSAPAMRSRLNTAFQFPIRSNPYGFTKDTIPPATTPCSKGSQSQRVSGMMAGDLD